MLIDFQKFFNSRKRNKFAIKHIKFPSHLKCVAPLPCEIGKDTNCAEIIIKAYHVMALKSHTRLISYWHCHRICSKYPPLTCILVHWCEFFIFQQDSTFTHTARDTLWFLEQVASVYVVKWSSPNINPAVASPNSMSTSCMCSKCQWTEAASVRHLVQHGTQCRWQCN